MQDLLPFFLREYDNSDDLTWIANRAEETGGSVVMYQQVFSLVIFTVLRTVFVHVPEGRSKVLVGFKHAAISLLFGPWSWLGPFMTLHALLLNLTGGFDMTDLEIDRPRKGYVPVEDPVAAAERRQKTLEYGYVTILFVILGAIVWKVVLPVFDPSFWPLSSVLALLGALVFGVLIAAWLSKRDKDSEP